MEFEHGRARTPLELDSARSRRGAALYGEVLERQLERLGGGIDLPARYFYELSIRHEDMHVEALAYTRQTLGYASRQDSACHGSRPPEHWPGDVEVPGGTLAAGLHPEDGFIFDNEKWAHEVALAPFRIAKAPVTNGEFAAFVEEGGYRRREFWTAEGWYWRERAGAQRPVYWLEKEGGGWFWRQNDEVEPLAPHAPVTFVNWYEAQAWCRWAKRRLPTEAEWEAAALGRTERLRFGLADGKRWWPWGDAPPDAARANLDFAYAGQIDVGACAAGDSAFGCRQMIGNAWEWTASDFRAV